jgi:hypothetical protein
MDSKPRIILDEDKVPKPIHYAIDIVNDTFYFGLVLPIEVDGKIYDGYAYLNDKGELFPSTEENLRERRLIWRTEPRNFCSRLSVSGVKRLIDGATCASCETCVPTQRIEQELRKYIDLSNPYEYTLIPLWIIGTYLQPIWHSYPYLAISGVTNTGKTKLLTFIKQVAFNGILSVSVTTSNLFRIINDTKCTFLIDEAARLSLPERYQDIREILLAGYKKGEAVYRTEEIKGRYIPMKFEVFSPKSIVTYKGLEEVLNNRSISIVMLRSTNKDILNREIDETDPIWDNLRNCLYAFVLKNWREIKKLYDNHPRISFIEGRNWELWKPLVILMSYLYGEEKMIDFCLNYVKPKIAELVEDGISTPENLLLTALSLKVDEDGYFTVSQIKNWIWEIIKAEHGELDDEGCPKWLTNDWVGSTLSKQFNIPRQRSGGKPRYYITRKDVQKLCRKYGIHILGVGTQDAHDAHVTQSS